MSDERELVCSATYLRVRGPWVLPGFLLQTWRVVRAARRTPGSVSVRLLGLPPLPFFWTVTVWESQEAMDAFVATEPHRLAMAAMSRWGSVGRFTRFTSTRRPGWRRALRELRAPSGRWTRPHTEQ